jgi:hypothetical protein
MTGLILALLFPDALLPIAIAYGVSTIALWLGRRRIGSREFYWGLWILAPALPVLTYDLLVLQGNPIVYSWVMQRSDSTASFPMLLLAAAIPLLLAVPGLWRALRYFEPDGDRFMLVWLVAMVVVAYFPVPLRQFALVGMMLPIAYFTTRSIEDFWFSYVRRRYRNLLYAFGIALMSVGHVIWLFMPVVPIVQKWVQHDGNVLSQDYTDALTWLDSQVDSSDVVLAAPAVSVWIPFRTGARVVFGHPIETDQAAERLQELVQWYAISDPERCNDLIDRYQVDVVVYGSHERRYGEARCLQNLVSVAAFGDVEIYATTYLLSNQP